VFRPALFVLAVANAVSGCTLAGGLVGSSVPEYTPTSIESARDGMVSNGERVAVVRASDGARFVGAFRGVDSGGIEIQTDDALVSVETWDVQGLSVARGNYWLEGALIGLAIDITVVVVARSETSHAYPDTSTFGNIHIGSDGVTVGGR